MRSSAVPILNPAATSNHSDALLLFLHVVDRVKTQERRHTRAALFKKMSTLTRFQHHFINALWKIQVILYGLSTLLVVNAAAIAYFEKMPFADALYFTFITGLTIGYGDIAPVTLLGRVIAILTGLLGVIITGLIVAVAVYALRKAMEPPADSH